MIEAIKTLMETINWSTFIATIISSTAISAFISGYVSRKNFERKLYNDNVTQERARWREKIREHTSNLPSSLAREGLILELATRLNPYDQEDIAIIETLKGSTSTKDNYAISEMISLLLKHDWERLKYETKPFILRIISPKPIRVLYRELLSTKKECGSDLSALKRKLKTKKWLTM